jgi:hypothetical protein
MTFEMRVGGLTRRGSLPMLCIMMEPMIMGLTWPISD